MDEILNRVLAGTVLATATMSLGYAVTGVSSMVKVNKFAKVTLENLKLKEQKAKAEV